MPQTIESFEEFAARHGNEPITVEGGKKLYADGATAETYAPIRTEPPIDKHKLLEARKRYLTAKMERLVGQFNSARATWGAPAKWSFDHGTPGPPPNAKEILDAMRKDADATRQEVAEIDKQLAAPIAEHVERNAELDRKHRAELQQQFNEIAQSTL